MKRCKILLSGAIFLRQVSVKKTDWILRAVLGAVLLGCGANALFAQACKDMPYLHQNKFDPKPIELGQVQGTAVDQNGDVLTQVCVGLFSGPDRTLVRYAQSGSKGVFTVDTKGLPDGEYRLVGQLIGFCPANAIIDIKSHSHHKKPLVVHMNLSGTDTCSYVEVSKK